MADGKDPASIERDIEQTRAELAATVDAIADRVSPRRAAARGAGKVREAVESLRASAAGGGNGHRPVRSLVPTRLALPAGSDGPVDTFRARALRVDRVAIAAGAGLALALATILLIRRRSR